MDKKLKKLLADGNPIMALFVKEAVLGKAKAVTEDGLKDWPENHIISRELWLQLAKDCIAALD